MIQKLYREKKLKIENIFYINKELFVFDHIQKYDDLKNEFALEPCEFTIQLGLLPPEA